MANTRIGSIAVQTRVLFRVGAIGGLTDGELLHRFVTHRDDESAELAFAGLVERHGPMVLRVCRSVLRHPHDAHDAYQATFMVLTRRAKSLWVRDSLGPWLHGVAYRVALYARSAAARRQRHERRAAEELRTVAEEGWDDTGAVLHEEINRLPERNRVVIVLCHLEGRTHDEAASVLGWPVGTVRSRLARGRELLKARMTRRGVISSVATLAGTLTADTASAALPTSLTDLTVRFAITTIAGRTSVGAIPATFLAEGFLKAMLATKLKMIAVGLLLIGTCAGGTAVFAIPQSGPQEKNPLAEETGRGPARGSTGTPRRISDEVRLLKAQIETKKAELDRAKAQQEVAEALKAKNDRLNIRIPGSVSQEDQSKTAAELKIAQAGVAVNQGEIRELELQLSFINSRQRSIAKPGDRSPTELDPRAEAELETVESDLQSAKYGDLSPTELDSIRRRPMPVPVRPTFTNPDVNRRIQTEFVPSPLLLMRQSTDQENQLMRIERKLDQLIKTVEARNPTPAPAPTGTPYPTPAPAPAPTGTSAPTPAPTTVIPSTVERGL